MTHVWIFCRFTYLHDPNFFQTFHLTFWHLIWQSVRDRGRRRSFRSNLRPRVDHEISPVSSWYLDITIIIALSFLMVKSPLLIWLVVDLPLWKIWKSVEMMTFPMEKITFMFHYWFLYPTINPIKNTMVSLISHYIPSIIYVPNHQPVMLIFFGKQIHMFDAKKSPWTCGWNLTVTVRCKVKLKSPVLNNSGLLL